MIDRALSAICGIFPLVAFVAFHLRPTVFERF
jgi:hypothetical protein